MTLDQINRREKEIREAGPKAISAALAAGVPVYYYDDRLGEEIVKEMPDGRRYGVKVEDGEDIVVKTFAPKI
jgi:hypothetical protein